MFIYSFQGGNDKDSIDKLIKAIKNSKNGKSVGIFGKEKYPGTFMDAWRTEFEKGDFNTVCNLVFYLGFYQLFLFIQSFFIFYKG